MPANFALRHGTYILYVCVLTSRVFFLHAVFTTPEQLEHILSLASFYSDYEKADTAEPIVMMDGVPESRLPAVGMIQVRLTRPWHSVASTMRLQTGELMQPASASAKMPPRTAAGLLRAIRCSSDMCGQQAIAESSCRGQSSCLWLR